MKHILASHRWVGFLALACGLVVLSTLLLARPGSAFLVLVVIVFAPVGIYASFRGLFLGGTGSRTCAGLSLPFWLVFLWYFSRGL